MEFITKSYLKNVRAKVEKNKGTRMFSEMINESKTRSSKSGEVTIFLSHKHDEIAQLEESIALLKDHGVNVYVDHNDDDMPKTTSGTTAAKIKKKIKENKKFILLATDAAIASKWCNWELGFGDAEKFNSNNIALLVVKEDSTNWTGNEYLQIYPVIGRTYSTIDGHYEVQYPNGTKIDLKKWLDS